ncbi:Hypothetical predicted protein [Mytilus galloprovincialis]|uniref:RNase H type-1 domain-containing protein n=1 Tax=Mytilus galloprovincialis TaxID=29158 RepID=A0A8B6D1H7_MYTGA|nr:Hypothetical predicted protein [Mytilus galloprovincialis]
MEQDSEPVPVRTLPFTPGASQLRLSRPSRVSHTVTRPAEIPTSPVACTTSRQETLPAGIRSDPFSRTRWPMNFAYPPMPMGMPNLPPYPQPFDPYSAQSVWSGQGFGGLILWSLGVCLRILHRIPPRPPRQLLEDDSVSLAPRSQEGNFLDDQGGISDVDSVDFMACSGIVKPESKGYYSFPESGHFTTALSFVNSSLAENLANTSKTGGSKFSGFGPASYPGRCRSKDFEIHGSSLGMSAPACDRAFSSLLGSKPLDGLRLSQASYVKSENNLRQLSTFCQQLGLCLKDKGEEFSDLRSMLLQVDKSLGMSQFLLLGTVANFTLAKRQEILEKSTVSEALQQRLVSSPLSKDKLFSVSLEQLQEEVNKAPPVVKVDVKVTDGKRFVKTTQMNNPSSSSSSHQPKASTSSSSSQSTKRPAFSRPNYSSGKKAKVVKGKKQVGGRLSHFLDQWALITSDKWVLSILRRGLELQFLEQPPLSPVPINLSVTKDSQKNQLLQKRSEHSYSEGCVGGGKSSFSSRVLFPAVLGSQEERENETGSRSFCSQSVSGGPTFQNGDQQVYQVDNSFRNLDNLSRFDGRLFSHPYFSQVSSFPETGLGRQGLQFQGYAFWPGYCTPSFYQDFSDGGVLSSYSGSTHSLLPRRFSHQESLPISFGGTHQFVYPFTPETGFFDFMGKIRDNSQSEFQFPGRTFSDRFGSSASSRREGSQGTSVSQCSDSVFICPSSSIASAGGFLDFDHGRHSTRTSTHSSNPVVSDRSFGIPISQLWEAPVPILPRLLPHLQWWLQEKHLRKGVLLDPPDPSLTLFTDASLMGWGAYLEGRTASGLWSGAQLEEHINLLEMRAVFLSLRQFQAVIQGQSLLVATDNSTVVAYLQNQGGTHSFSLYHLSKEILLLCHSLNIFLSVRHVPGSQNLLADALSRSRVPVNTEWEIHPSVFQEIILRWDRPHIDLFATSLNHKLETYVSPIPDEKAWAVDAMTLSWKGMFSYMFPPFRLLPKILHKIQRDLCKTILIAPAWPRQSWFPELLLLCCAKPLCLASKRGSTVSIQRKKTASGSGESPSARLVVVRNSLRKGGFSEGATKRISGSVRQSTGAVYDSKWSIFLYLVSVEAD